MEDADLNAILREIDAHRNRETKRYESKQSNIE